MVAAGQVLECKEVDIDRPRGALRELVIIHPQSIDLCFQLALDLEEGLPKNFVHAVVNKGSVVFEVLGRHLSTSQSMGDPNALLPPTA
eukprot:32484-Prymnesium_polylepis.4